MKTSEWDMGSSLILDCLPIDVMGHGSRLSHAERFVNFDS